MKCRQCQKDFPIKVVIDGRKRNLQTRKFCLECSPFGLHNTKPSEPKLINVVRKPGDIFQDTCRAHGLTEFITRPDLRGRCKKCSVDAVTQCRRKSKRKLIEAFGGCCKICGYNKCPRALQFHHLEPAEKSFNISHQGMCRSWDKMLAEANKCVLLCANCHAEVESGITTVT